jgi:uncharacterized protein (TIGR03118 family)
MKCSARFLKSSLLLGFTVLLLPDLALAQHYKQTNLVSDIAGMAPTIDPNLKNPWGQTRSPGGSPWWVSNNNSGTATLYTGTGQIIPINGNGVVIIPPPAFEPNAQSAPTGVVFNGSPTDFLVSLGVSAHFIFATEDGTISAWAGGKNAVLKVDNSDNGSANGAVYKGATSAEVNGKRFLYVTNFRSGKVEVYDTNFNRVHLDEDAFDPDADSEHDGDGEHHSDEHGAERIPRDFAPFNIQNIGGTLFVTYAKQDAPRHDPVGGDGLGFVELFTPSGKHIGSLEHGDWFNAPWGAVWTTRDFGEFSNAILIGNFRSGWIAAFNGFTRKFIGFVRNSDNSLMFIDGLWSLTFGNDGTAGPANTLFFTAGINNENDGLFGTITPIDGLDGDEE